VRRKGETKFGTRTETKNVNSFRFVEKAIEFEIARQIEVIESGGKIVQETRLFNPDTGETRMMRTKEDANDYRYFPDPDLLPVVVTKADIERIRATQCRSCRRPSAIASPRSMVCRSTMPRC